MVVALGVSNVLPGASVVVLAGWSQRNNHGVNMA